MPRRKAKPAKAGRPTDYSKALGDRVCSAIAGGSNLNRVCEQDDMPSRETVYKWFRIHTEFADNYARSREDRADWRSDRIDDYVKQLLAGTIDANQARVAIDAEKWQAGKEKPKRYGDKLELSGDKDNPLTIAVGVEKSLDAKLDRLIGRRT